MFDRREMAVEQQTWQSRLFNAQPEDKANVFE